MTSIHDVDLDSYCGRLGRLYSQHGLCPPYSLRHAAESWIAKGIPLSFCVDVVGRYLSQAGACYSGSGDRNFAWLNGVIQTKWYERSFAMLPLISPHSRLGDTDTDEQSFHAVHRTPYSDRPPNSLGARSAVGAPPRAVMRKPAPADQVIRSGSSRYRSLGQPRSPGPKKIHLAVAWLLAELARGEKAASVVEAKALSSGIAPRTIDRARKRLGITSRRIGFGRRARYMIALPAALATPNVASTERAADEEREGKRKE